MAIILPILSTFNATGVKAAQNSLGGLGNTLSTLGKRAAGAVAGFSALQGAINFTGNAISEARDLERNMAALSTVFADLTPRMTNFVNNANNMGLSQVEAARTSTYLGSVLKQAGFGMEDVADNTEKLTVLAQDLATTFGYDTTVALTAMTAMFRGEYDPIEKFGVALKQNEVNALVAAKGLGHLTGVAMLNAQQMVRMEQLFLRSADAQGAFARQAGTLFVEQKKLTAGFSNMQAAIGLQLTPALADLMQQLVPIVNNLAPKLVETFGFIGGTISNLVGVVRPLGTIFESLIDVGNILAGVLTPLGNNIATILVVAFENLAAVVQRAAYWVDVIDVALKELNGTIEETDPSPITQWLEGLGDRLGSFNLLYILAKNFKEEVKETNLLMGLGQIRDQGGRDRAASRARAAALKRAARLGTDDEDEPKGPAPKDFVADFYKQLKDEIDKQAGRLKLQSLGASEALIESIIGSGEGFRKVLAKVTASGKAGIAKLQRDFSKTAAGIDEIKKAFDATVEAAEKKHAEAMKLYEADLEVYNKQKDAINALKKSLTDLLSGVAPLAIVTREIGQFEQSTIDSFNEIVKTITDGLADGTLLKTAADALTKYARSEQTTIQNLMRQRDELSNRRGMAQAMIDDVKTTIRGLGNITELLAKNTTDVTETITKMVGQVQVATQTVIKGANGGAAGLIKSFTDTLAKTKEFANQLKDLRALGLDKNLYQQIVTAGIDAGGATAKAILDGGAGTVSELNTLFAELDSVGTSIAEQSAQVMYGAGIDVTDGLIAGLLSKEQELVDAATQLANSFTTAFNQQMSLALPMPNAPSAPIYVAPEMPKDMSQTFRLGDVKLGGYDAKTTALATKLIASPKATAWNTTITVNAGFGTDGKATGQAIYSELLRFAKSSGIKI